MILDRLTNDGSVTVKWVGHCIASSYIIYLAPFLQIGKIVKLVEFDV